MPTLSDICRNLRFLITTFSDPPRVRSLPVKRRRIEVEQLETRMTPSSMYAHTHLQAIQPIAGKDGIVLTKGARLESFLLNDNYRQSANSMHELLRGSFAWEINKQSFSLVVAERDSFEAKWFQLGRPHANYASVAHVLNRLQAEYVAANRALVELQNLEIQQGKILPYTPPVF
jgi:hypothetical protein